MKKVVAIYLSLIILLITITSGISESLELSTMDDTALLDLLLTVQQEVVNRNIEKKTEIQPGVYCAGKDFPAGSYLISKIGDEGIRICAWSAKQFESSGTIDSPDLYFEYVYDDAFHIVLSEGDALRIEGSAVILTIQPAVIFE